MKHMHAQYVLVHKDLEAKNCTRQSLVFVACMCKLEHCRDQL